MTYYCIVLMSCVTEWSVSCLEICISVVVYLLGLPWGLSDKNCLHCRRYRFDPWVREIPWSRKWQPTPISLIGKFHGQEESAGYSPWNSKESRRHDWATEHAQWFYSGGYNVIIRVLIKGRQKIQSERRQHDDRSWLSKVDLTVLHCSFWRCTK